MQRLLVPPDVIAGGRAEALLLGAFALLDDLERLRAGEAEGLAHLLYFFVSITRRLLALPRNARPPPPGGPGLPGAAWAPREGWGVGHWAVAGASTRIPTNVYAGLPGAVVPK